jgi:hypothetical protein
MWVAADRAFMLTSKMKVMSALFVAEPLRSSYLKPTLQEPTLTWQRNSCGSLDGNLRCES